MTNQVTTNLATNCNKNLIFIVRFFKFTVCTRNCTIHIWVSTCYMRRYFYICLFPCSSHSKTDHRFGYVTPNVKDIFWSSLLCTDAIELRGFFSMQHLLLHGTSDSNDHHQGHVTLSPAVERFGRRAVTTCFMHGLSHSVGFIKNLF